MSPLMCLLQPGAFGKGRHFMNRISHPSYLLQDNSSRLLLLFRAVPSQVCLVEGWTQLLFPSQLLLLFSLQSFGIPLCIFHEIHLNGRWDLLDWVLFAASFGKHRTKVWFFHCFILQPSLIYFFWKLAFLQKFHKHLSCSLSAVKSYGPTWAGTMYSAASLLWERCLGSSHLPMNFYGPSCSQTSVTPLLSMPASAYHAEHPVWTPGTFLSKVDRDKVECLGPSCQYHTTLLIL